MQVTEKNSVIKESTKSVWGASPAGTTYGNNHQKGTKDFFESVIAKRFGYECDWLEEIVDFKQFKGKSVLEIGCGAGYDAYQFCKHGADYTGIDITPDNILIAKKHLSFYNYFPTIVEMDVEELSLSEHYDFVFSFGVLHHTPDITKALKKIHEVLVDAGQIQIIVYNKNSIFYWLRLVFFDWLLKFNFLKMSLKERISQIEYTTSEELPFVHLYTKKEIQKLIRDAGFTIIKTDIRKLTKEDLLDIPLLRKFYRNNLLKFLGKRFGWYISVQAIKS